MKNKILQFAFSAFIYWFVDYGEHYIFTMPHTTLVGLSPSVLAVLGLMWGFPAGLGCMAGALASEYEDFLDVPTVFVQDGAEAGIWLAILLFCNCGFWAFMASYLPYRLWHSMFTDPGKSLFALRTDVILKFVKISFITALATALFLAMTTQKPDMLYLLDGLDIKLGLVAEYALTCFLNDFNMTIFLGLICFTILVSFDYPFHLPLKRRKYHPEVQKAFDTVFFAVTVAALVLCFPGMTDYEGIRFFVGIVLSLYIFRPLSPPPIRESRHRKIMIRGNTGSSRKTAAVFYIFFLVTAFLLNWSGVVYGLEDPGLWRQLNFECMTAMGVALVGLLYMLLRYKDSVMTNIVLLEVGTVFVSAIVLGGICFVITDRITGKTIEDTLETKSLICREKLEKTFTGIEVSVEDVKDLATARLDSYERFVEDEAWRQNYLQHTEALFRAIASNTEGSVAFYMRLNPEIAGSSGGFSWGSTGGSSEDQRTIFYRRDPIDLSKYSPDDKENVGWFYIPKQRKKSAWTEPYTDPTVKSYVISYVTPIYIDENFVGVIGMDIDFKYLVKEIRGLQIYDSGYAYLIDDNGKVLYHKNFEPGETFTPNPHYRHMTTYLSDGMTLGIAAPLSEVYRERNNLLIHLICFMLLIAVLVSSLSIYLASRGIRPLLALTEAAQKIASGNLDVDLPEESKNELGTLVKSIREMVSKLEIYVYRDKLTGLSNTTAYARKCGEIENYTAAGMKYAVIVFDVNFLKKINDTYGHEAGNELIRSAADTIKKVFTESPVFRIGGDEFVAILESEGDYENRDELLKKFDETVANTELTFHDEGEIFSIARGIGIWEEGKDYATVFQEADEAMYLHKSAIKKKLHADLR